MFEYQAEVDLFDIQNFKDTTWNCVANFTKVVCVVRAKLFFSKEKATIIWLYDQTRFRF